MDEEFRPDDKILIRKLYKVKLTVGSMIRQRGYIDTNNLLSEDETYEEFEAKYRVNPHLMYLVFKVYGINKYQQKNSSPEQP